VKTIYEEIARLHREGKPAALVTVVKTKGSVPREAGAKMAVLGDGSIIGTVGGAILEARAIEKAKEVIRAGKPCTVEFNLNDPLKTDTGMICGGWMELFIEPLITSPTLTIFGGGHCGKPLADMADLLGWGVVVYDDRPEWANQERFPYAREVKVGDFLEMAKSWQSASPAYVAIMTRGHEFDEIVLREMLNKQWDYLGMMASQKKKTEIFDRLKANGVDAALLEKVSSPIGLDISSETPAEIAVSILAEMIKVYRQQGVGA
jgi:xanthine dehydrogenase accessory factor